MEFQFTVLKVELSQLNYRIHRLQNKLDEEDTTDPDYERASEMLQQMKDYRNNLRYFYNINKANLGGK